MCIRAFNINGFFRLILFDFLNLKLIYINKKFLFLTSN